MLAERIAMRTISHRLLPAFPLLLLAACSGTPTRPQAAAVIHYQHVANVHRVWFASPLDLGARPVDYVLPRDPEGFWAVFMVCGLEVGARGLPSFVYDVSNFRVEYNGRQFGLLPPYSLRYENSHVLNRPIETPAVASAIAAELQEGPSLQVFSHGSYSGLNYRFALFLPRGIPDYAGEQLNLIYKGQPALAVGKGYPPYDIRAVGGNAAGVAAACRP